MHHLVESCLPDHLRAASSGAFPAGSRPLPFGMPLYDRPQIFGGAAIGAIFGGLLVLPSALIGGGVVAIIGSPPDLHQGTAHGALLAAQSHPSGPRSCDLDSDCDLGLCIEKLCRGDYH